MGSAQFLIIILLAPLVNGLIKKLKAAMQGRVGPALTQPYWDLLRLFRKEMVIANTTSWVFRATPYVVFASMACTSMLVPVLTVDSSVGFMGDVIAIIYLFGLARFFTALGGLDAATAFGGEGSSREMTTAIFIEPVLMLCIFTAAITAGSTNVASIASSETLKFGPSHLMAFAALLVVIIAETGRVPVDNPDTHLELTMIHEGMVLEYSGRYLALMEWAHYIKQLVLFTLAADIFLPAGIALDLSPEGLLVAAGAYGMKVAALALTMALVESTRAKMRFFQVPSYLGMAFVLALLSLITSMMMGGKA